MPADARRRRRRGRRALPQHRRPTPAARRGGAGARDGAAARGEVVATRALPPDCREGMSLTRYEPAHPRLQRSELAVPRSPPALFPKALDREAGYVLLDLRDPASPAAQ